MNAYISVSMDAYMDYTHTVTPLAISSDHNSGVSAETGKDQPTDTS